MKEGLIKTMKQNVNNPYFLYYIQLIFSKELIYLILIFSIAVEIEGNIIDLSSEIHLVIKGSGNQSIINNMFYLQPDEVYVNGMHKESCKTICELEYEENNVTLVFNHIMNSTKNMFYQLVGLKEIDFSDFDFSYVTSMTFMFSFCSNLEKIDFGNINTSSLVDMTAVFYNCSNLTSVDVSKFDTSLVTTMEGLFYNCSSLEYIDVSNLILQMLNHYVFYFIHVKN